MKLKMKKIFCGIILTISMFSFNVYASNDVDYTLTITDDFKFKEVINYSITDYKQIVNGYNYFYTIVSEDVYTDIFYNTSYKKTKVKTDNGYKVKLSHTYSEYSFSNSNFLNNCFENSSYDYDIDNYSFEGKGGFYCLNGDSLRITVITNMNVVSSNAVSSGNEYIWTPTDENFTMNVKIVKDYLVKETDEGLGHGVDEQKDVENGEIIPEGTDVYDTDNPTNNDTQVDNQNQKNTTGYIIGGIILVMCVIVILIIARVLKQKKSNLNKI